ncbi:phage tail length tape measure family protein [Pseudoroseomonas deserti]|uniref:phage tail length tape measure family protein n=1 Tax=Teichococcus deserti TaxID=1817963 RepID=UPI001A96DB59|nr:phage tail length tape measure family protein [Pseudoroseomonas deserti]
MKSGFADQVKGLKGVSQEATVATNRLGLTGDQMRRLAPQINDVVVSLYGGMPPLQVLVQQGGQITDIFGGVKATFAAVVGAINPMVAGVTAIAVALGAAAIAAETMDRRTRELQNRLQAYRTDAAVVAPMIDPLARTVSRTSGASVGETRDAALTLAQTRGFNLDDMEKALRLAQDMRVAMGTDLATAVGSLSSAYKDASAAAQGFADQGMRGFNGALVRQLELLELAGRGTEATRIVLERLKQATAGADDNLTDLERAWRGLAKSSGEAWDAIRPGVELIGGALISALAHAISMISGLVSGILSIPDALAQATRRMASSAPDTVGTRRGTLRGGLRSGWDSTYGADGAPAPVDLAGTLPPTPPDTVPPSSSQLISNADKLTASLGGRLYRQQTLLAQRQGIQAAMQLPSVQADPAKLAQYRDALAAIGEAMQGLEGPAAQFLDSLTNQVKQAEAGEGAARALREAELALDEAVKQAGQGHASNAAQAQARALVMRRLEAEFTTYRAGVNRDITGARNQAQAYLESTAAGRAMTAEMKARQEALKYGVQGTAEYDRYVRILTSAFEQQAIAEADLAAARSVDDMRRELEMIEAETKLVGASTEQRERELAVLKARQQILANGGDPETEAGKAAIQMAGDVATARAELTRTQNAFSELQQIGEQAFDRIGSAITEAFTNGSGKAINFGSIVKGILSEVAQSVLKLGVLNPVLNSLFGGSRTTLGGAMSAASSAGGVATAAAGGGGLGSVGGLGGISSLFNLGSSSLSIGVDAWGAANLGSLGFSGPATTAGASTLGHTSADALLASMPAGPTPGLTPGLIGGGDLFGGFSSLSNVLGIAGAALPGLISGNYAQAGLGLGGAALGTMILPGIGTALGGMVGNLVGGLFGGQKQHKAASVQYGMNEDGQLVVTGSKSKWMDDKEAVAQTTQALLALNQKIAALGLTLDGATAGQTHFGEDSRPEEDSRNMTLAVLEGMRGGTDNMTRVITAELSKAYAGDADLDRAMANIEWVKNLYDPLVGAGKAGSALTQQIEALTTSFGEHIAKAEELGLATDVLWRKQAEAIEAAKNAVRSTYDAAVRELDGRTYVDQVTAVRSYYNANEASFRDAGRDPEALFDRQMRAVLNTFSDAQLRDIATAFVGIDDAAVTLAKQLLETGSAAQRAANQAVATGYWQTSRQAEGRGYVNSVEGVRTFYEQNRAAFEAAGVDGVRLFHQQMTAVLDQLNADQLRDIAVSFRGLDDAAADAAEQMLRLGNSTTKAIEAAELAARQQLGGSIRSYVDGMRATAAGGSTPQQQLQAAQEQFGRDLALARGGNVEASGRITGTADNLMKALDQMYGSTAEGRQGRDWVLSQLEQLPATQSYDALILAELQKLGGRIDVSVELTTFRVITETLNALADADRKKLVQAETVLRTVEDRLGRALSTAERSRLIEGEVVLRSVEQSLGRNLTAAERASLVSSGDVLRAIEQRIGRQLTAAEAAGLVQSGTITRQVQELLGRSLTAAEAASLTAGGAVLRSVQEALGRSLTAAESASLVQGETVRRLVEQTMGRSLTAAERDGLVQAASVIRSVEQQLGRSLTEAERGTLLASITVTRTVDQVIGRTLTAGELASFQASQTVLRRVEETLGRTLTAAERNALLQSTSIDRVVRETLGRTLTTAEDATLAKAGAVVRTVEQKLGRALTEAERASLVATATVTRTVQQAMGRSLTAAERAGLVASEDVLRRVEQTLGRNLTAAEKAELVAGGTVARAVEQRLGATLTAAERASLVQGGSVLRSVEQALGRQLTAAETAALIPAGTVDRTVMQQVRALTASQLTQLVNGEAVVRTVEQALGRTLTAAERAQLLESATLRRTVDEAMGRVLTAAEKASLAQATTVIRSVEERLGRTLTAAEDASLVAGGTVVRQIQQQLGRNLTAAERAAIVATATVERNIRQELERNLTVKERAALVASEDVLRRVEQTLGRNLTAAEKAELIAGGTVSRAVEQRLGATLTAAERASLVQGGSVLQSVEQALGRQLTAAEKAALIPAGSVDREVVQAVRSLTAAQQAELVGADTVTRQIEQALGRTLTAAERAELLDSATVRREVTEALGARLTAAEKASLAQGGTVLQSIEQQLGRQLTEAERQTVLTGGTVTRTVDQQIETTETVLISRSIDDKIGASLKAQTDLLSAMKGSTATQAQTLAVLDGRLRNIDLWTYGLRELARGQWGGIRVTTPKASGAANDPANFNTTIGNWGTTLTVNALGNAFAGGNVVPFAKGGVPRVDEPTFFPMAGGNVGLLGEAGPEAILPLKRMANGELGVQADIAGLPGLMQEILQRILMPFLVEEEDAAAPPGRLPSPAPTRPSGSDSVADLVAELREVKRQLAELRAERSKDAQAAQATAERSAEASERTAEAAEDTADSNRRMARKREPLMQRGGTK